MGTTWDIYDDAGHTCIQRVPVVQNGPNQLVYNGLQLYRLVRCSFEFAQYQRLTSILTTLHVINDPVHLYGFAGFLGATNEIPPCLALSYAGQSGLLPGCRTTETSTPSLHLKISAETFTSCPFSLALVGEGPVGTGPRMNRLPRPAFLRQRFLLKAANEMAGRLALLG